MNYSFLYKIARVLQTIFDLLVVRTTLKSEAGVKMYCLRIPSKILCNGVFTLKENGKGTIGDNEYGTHSWSLANCLLGSGS